MFTKPVPAARRLRFPEDEARLRWLRLLLDSYAIADEGVARAIGRRKGEALACREGCGNCCVTHHDIPVYPIEVEGLKWYASEKLPEALRGPLKDGLGAHRREDPCPFIVEGSCSVHPMRPMACRHFNVFGEPCAAGEDPYYTRREDVLTPIREYIDWALFVTLPFYGVADEVEKIYIIDNGLLNREVRVLQLVDWAALAGAMDQPPAQ